MAAGCIVWFFNGFWTKELTENLQLIQPAPITSVSTRHQFSATTGATELLNLADLQFDCTHLVSTALSQRDSQSSPPK